MPSSAKLKYRLYVPHDYIAVEFCDLDFYGDNREEYENQWNKIEFKKYDEVEKTIEPIRIQIEELSQKVKSISEEIRAQKKVFLIFKSKYEKELIERMCEYSSVKEKLCKDVKSLEKERFYEAYELKSRAELFLEKHGFLLVSHSSSGGDCCTDTEVWNR